MNRVFAETILDGPMVQLNLPVGSMLLEIMSKVAVSSLVGADGKRDARLQVHAIALVPADMVESSPTVPVDILVTDGPGVAIPDDFKFLNSFVFGQNKLFAFYRGL